MRAFGSLAAATIGAGAAVVGSARAGGGGGCGVGVRVRVVVGVGVSVGTGGAGGGWAGCLSKISEWEGRDWVKVVEVEVKIGWGDGDTKAGWDSCGGSEVALFSIELRVLRSCNGDTDGSCNGRGGEGVRNVPLTLEGIGASAAAGEGLRLDL